MFSKILDRLAEIRAIDFPSVTLMNACDADWSVTCEKEKMVNTARLVTVGNLLDEIARVQ